MDNKQQNWADFRLRDICLKTTLSNPTKQPEKKFIYVDVSSVSNDSYRITESKELLGKDAPSRARKLIQTDDIIFATVRPTLKRIALVPEELNNQICSTGYCVVRANKSFLEPAFIYYYFLTEKVAKRVEKLQKGATYPAISDSDLFSEFVNLPPLYEQRAIAKILKAIQESKESRQKELELEREGKAALMHYLFTHGTRSEKTKQTEIGKMPESWQALEIKEVYSFTKKPKHIQYSTYSFIPFVPMELIPNQTPNSSAYINKSPSDLTSGTYFEEGDLLIAKITPCFENGKQAIIEGLPINFGVATTEVIPIKERNNISNKFYLFYYLQMQKVRNELAGKMEGTTGRQRLGKSTVENYKIPFASICEQEEIVRILRSFDYKIASLRTEIESLNELFKAMLEELMTGKLSALPLVEKVAV